MDHKKPKSVTLRARDTGLPKDSVANLSQIVTIDRGLLTERTGHVSQSQLEAVLSGIDLVLGRETIVTIAKVEHRKGVYRRR